MKGKIFHVHQSPCRHEIFSNIDSKPKREVKRDTSWRLEITKNAEISSSSDCKKPMKPIAKVEKVTQKSKYWRKPETPKEISKENLLEKLDSIEVETEVAFFLELQNTGGEIADSVFEIELNGFLQPEVKWLA